jgi:hypothetical protein
MRDCKVVRQAEPGSCAGGLTDQSIGFLQRLQDAVALSLPRNFRSQEL